jgi:hypothetical protein
MHQISAEHRAYTRSPRAAQSGRARYPWKLSFGGNLYLLVMPKGGRYWHYCYRYSGKRKTLDRDAESEEPLVPQKLCGDNTGIITITEVTSDNLASRYS